MESGNYFDLPDCGNLICVVSSYGPSLEILWLQIRDQSGKVRFKVSFFVPYYLQMPIAWQGACFEIDSSPNYWALWRDRCAAVVSPDEYQQTHHLYSVKRDEITIVQILAQKAKLHKEADA